MTKSINEEPDQDPDCPSYLCSVVEMLPHGAAEQTSTGFNLTTTSPAKCKCL